MSATKIVELLIESDSEFYGPPEPDMYQKALGTARHLHGLHKQAAEKYPQLDKALQYERQLKRAGVTRDQVASVIRADEVDPKAYANGGRTEMVTKSAEGFIGRDTGSVRRIKPPYPADALMGFRLNDGREIMFDFPIVTTP